MIEKEYYYEFSEDDPGDIVEALNEDKGYYMYEVKEGFGILIWIDYNGIRIKITEQDER